MIKTLRITSVAAVLLAVVVLASVLGYERYASLLPLNLGMRTDKQTEKILGGPTAVERFKEQYGTKAPDQGQDKTPPLIKQAEMFANIINPPALDGTRPTQPSKNIPKPTLAAAKPIGPVSSKFDLLATCCSCDPKTSFAQIRLVDGTYQWVGVGSAIGHVTIKEIHNGSIVCSDGGRDFPMDVQATPETSSLLETGKAPKDAGAKAQASTESPTAGRGPSVKPPTAAAVNPLVSPVKPNMGSARATALGARSAQISKEEQANLSQLGDKLKAGTTADPNKLISDYKSSLGTAPAPGSVPNPTSDPADASKGASWKDKLKEDSKMRWQNRLMPPRPPKK